MKRGSSRHRFDRLSANGDRRASQGSKAFAKPMCDKPLNPATTIRSEPVEAHSTAFRLAGSALAVAILLLAGCQPVAVKQAPPAAEPSPSAQASASQSAAKPAQPHKKKPKKPKAPKAAVIPAPAAPATGRVLIARLVDRFADPPCVEDRVVQRWERLYTGYPPRFSASLEAVLPLVALVLEELETHGLPGEFALLPIVESWYRPDAAHAGAVGMWQFTASTAKLNGLRIMPGFDERMAPQAATRAAMRYLGALYNRFGDWKLADMAYNAGDYRLQRAIGRQPDVVASAAGHQPAGLSMTTYEHLAKIQALACIVAQPERFRVTLPEGAIEPLHAVQAPPGTDTLDAVARLAGTDARALRRLNPAFAQGRIAHNAPRELLLPASAHERLRAPQLAANDAPRSLAVAEEASAAPREYVIRRGDTLGGIAQRLGVSLENLLHWNRLDVRSVIRPGQVLRLED
jgi:membrane-bound lytic murein transglycosylase D